MESLHPATIHFPIAFLMAAFGVETAALVLRQPSWHRISLWNLCLGGAAAGVAVFTGRMAGAVAKHSFEIHSVMEQHERLGYVVLALVGVAAGWRLMARDRLSIRARWMAWILLGLACGAMAFGAHLGGRLVYEFGVGGSYGRSRGGIEVAR